MGSGREGAPDKAATIRRILEAAYRVFGEKGLKSSTMDAIAERAGLSKQLIYHYFGNKDRLYIEVLNEHLRRSHDPLFENDFDRLDPVTAIRRLFEISYDRNLTHAAKLATDQLSAESRFELSDGLAERYGQRVTALVDDILARGREDGSLRPDADPQLVHALIWVLNVGFLSSRPLLSQYMIADLETPEVEASWRVLAIDAIIGALASNAPSRTTPAL